MFSEFFQMLRSFQEAHVMCSLRTDSVRTNSIHNSFLRGIFDR
ncbi:hypothetical protein LEP1GSC043_2264 [Leptospira weilii str. Ecochallenge]|uniref:Uncharacterized protein n=1 Tax=Leptospira weilii str. Ecochallenge TaxID=1049986 RepID=N1U8B0_9LEPT|nr:hypothetical protein LEP1GSC043_2264 [Leptospira weilii str. Ecochallenge]